jgi:hypothetical protein
MTHPMAGIFNAHTVRFTSHHDPDPSIASRKQDEKRRYQIEFQINTFVFDPE